MVRASRHRQLRNDTTDIWAELLVHYTLTETSYPYCNKATARVKASIVGIRRTERRLNEPFNKMQSDVRDWNVGLGVLTKSYLPVSQYLLQAFIYGFPSTLWRASTGAKWRSNVEIYPDAGLEWRNPIQRFIGPIVMEKNGNLAAQPRKYTKRV